MEEDAKVASRNPRAHAFLPACGRLSDNAPGSQVSTARQTRAADPVAGTGRAAPRTCVARNADGSAGAAASGSTAAAAERAACDSIHSTSRRGRCRKSVDEAGIKRGIRSRRLDSQSRNAPGHQAGTSRQAGARGGACGRGSRSAPRTAGSRCGHRDGSHHPGGELSHPGGDHRRAPQGLRSFRAGRGA